MKITKVTGGAGCTDGDTCPARYNTDRGTVVFVGRVVTDPDDLAQLGIGPGEAAVEVPREVAS